MKEVDDAAMTRKDADVHVTESVSIGDGANGRFTERDARRTGQATTATSARERVGESTDNAGDAQPPTCERQEKGGGVRDVEGLRVNVTEGEGLGDEESVIDEDGVDVGENEEVGELEREFDGVEEPVAVIVSVADSVGD